MRAAFSNERMKYIPKNQSQDGIAKVIYSSKDGKEKKTFDALDWLAMLTTHIPQKREQTVRYYGYYSNKLRGLRKKENKDEEIPQIIESSQSSKLFRKLWAVMIQKIYQVDPLVCPKCNGTMRIISFIDQPDIIKKILKHIGLWETNINDPPTQNKTHIPELTYDYSDSQLPEIDYWQ